MEWMSSLPMYILSFPRLPRRQIYKIFTRKFFLVHLKEKSFIFQEFIYPDARDRQFLLFFHKLSKRKIFDIKRYNEIKDAINKIEGNLQVLRSPLFLHLPENARTELLGNVTDKDDE